MECARVARGKGKGMVNDMGADAECAGEPLVASDELHIKLGAVARGLADLLQIPDGAFEASCVDGGEITMSLGVAEVLLLRGRHAAEGHDAARRLVRFVSGAGDAYGFPPGVTPTEEDEGAMPPQ